MELFYFHDWAADIYPQSHRITGPVCPCCAVIAWPLTSCLTDHCRVRQGARNIFAATNTISCICYVFFLHAIGSQSVSQAEWQGLTPNLQLLWSKGSSVSMTKIKNSSVMLSLCVCTWRLLFCIYIGRTVSGSTALWGKVIGRLEKILSDAKVPGLLRFRLHVSRTWRLLSCLWNFSSREKKALSRRADHSTCPCPHSKWQIILYFYLLKDTFPICV